MKPPEKPEKPRFKDRPLELRPRERLIQGSPQDLSNSELLAILFRAPRHPPADRHRPP